LNEIRRKYRKEKIYVDLEDEMDFSDEDEKGIKIELKG